MIQQQYYTREKRGLFSRTAGYDTIAVSKGLKANPGFIRSILHDKCFYDPPIELVNSSENDISRYPESITCYNTDKGDMVLGKAAYVGPDFTGERNTFFMHNFVISRQEREEFVHNPRKIIYSTGYQNSYNIEEGQEIPEVQDIPWNEESEGVADRFRLFKELNISSDIAFKKLIYAVFMSMVDKKKIYVSFDTDVNKLSSRALEVMKYLYRMLPYELRRNIGFITYAREPLNKKFINIVFIPKGGIKLTNNEIKKEYIFDFAQDKFFNTDTDVTIHSYIEFCMKYINDEQKLSSFFEYAEEMMQNMKSNEKLQLGKYDEFLIFYLLEQDEMWFYKQSKISVINNLFQYMNSRDIQGKQKERLDSVFTRILDFEETETRNISSYVTDIDVIDSIIKYYSNFDLEIKAKVDRLMAASIANGKMSNRNEYLTEIFGKAIINQDMFKKLITGLLEERQYKKEVLEWYLGKRISKIERLSKLYEEMDFWCKISLDVFNNEYFKDEIRKKFERFIRENSNFIYSGKNIREYLRGFSKRFLQYEYRDIRQLINSIEKITDDYIFENIRLDKLKKEDFLNINFSKIHEYEADDKIRALKCLYYLHMDNRGQKNLDEIERDIKRLDYTYINIIKELIRNFFSGDISSGRFDRIIIGFLANGSYDYMEAVDFINKISGAERVYDFILWASKNVRSQDGSEELLVEAVQKYFRSSDRTALRDKSIRKRMFGIKNLKIRHALKDLEYELSSGAKKALVKTRQGIGNFFNDYGRLVIQLVAIVLVALAVGGVVYMGVSYFRIKADLKNVEPATDITKTPEQKIEALLKGYEYSATASLVPYSEKLDTIEVINITSLNYEEQTDVKLKKYGFTPQDMNPRYTFDSSYYCRYKVEIVGKEGSISDEEGQRLYNEIDKLMIELTRDYYTNMIKPK